MQYLLTQEEYDALVNARAARSNEGRRKLQEFCTRVANEMPILWGWSADEKPKPWGCILTKTTEWYCDSCPAKDLCPHTPKEWSK